MFDIAI